MSSYPVPIYLPRRRRIVSPAEWLREKIREREQTIVRAAAWQASGTLVGQLTTTDVTPVIPTHAADDILICVTSNRNNVSTCLTPTNWTLLHSDTAATIAWNSYVFWKRATSGAETNPLCNWTGSGDKYAQVHTIRGAITTGSPFAASAFTVGTADPGVATGVTTAASNQIVVAVGLIGDDLPLPLTSMTATDPATFTERHSSTILTGADAGGFFFSATRATAGATGNVSADFAAAPVAWQIVVAAITDAPLDAMRPRQRVIGFAAGQRAGQW